MAKPNIYVTRLIPQEGLDLLTPHCRVEINPHDRPLTRDELLAEVRDRDGVIGLLMDRIDAEFFDSAKNLKGYANYAVGFDNIDLPEATRRGMPVSNTPDVLTLATAEAAWALLLAVARRVVEGDVLLRSGQWPGWGPLQFIGADVSGRTLGLVGPGRIGSAMARMSRGFDMKIIYVANRPNPELDRELGARRVEFDELLTEADFISIHTPLTPATTHLFNAASFVKMKPTAIIINTARGPIIKEDDLVAALKAGQIAGAGLDVYEREPALAAGLADCPTAVLTPHVGSGTASARNGMSRLAAQNVLAMVRGEQAPNCLNPEVYEK